MNDANKAALAALFGITPETNPWLYEHQCVACKEWGNTHIGNATCFDDRRCCDDAPAKRVFRFTGPDPLGPDADGVWAVPAVKWLAMNRHSVILSLHYSGYGARVGNCESWFESTVSITSNILQACLAARVPEVCAAMEVEG